LEGIGFSTIWLSGGPLRDLRQIVDAARATSKVRIATGIAAVDRFPPGDVAALYARLQHDDPDRLVVGLGAGRSVDPRATVTAYIDHLGAVPRSAIVLAALGPRMLDLARELAAWALPVLVTPDYTTRARERLGTGTGLAVEQLVVVESDPTRARAIARGPLGFLGRVPAYQANFRRMGFTDREVGELADRLVDALVPWGSVDAVAARILEQLDRGADHVAVSIPTAEPAGRDLEAWRALAARLIR
jgi:probable F420-dependent oxidoreductase